MEVSIDAHEAGGNRGGQTKNDGRGERIRTSGLYVPNVALYQAKLHPAEARDLVRTDLRCFLSFRSVAPTSQPPIVAKPSGTDCQEAFGRPPWLDGPLSWRSIGLPQGRLFRE